ncbi:hypothetical protein [Hyphomicrobium sp. DY-1]|uniref:hypothetical protein n=1 Tax=Hyphomicrobium sp. DY-1 TaxID=3075650 RepID=UPI0039C2EB4E
MAWASKLKEVAKARGETLALSPDLEMALLCQERMMGRVEEPYDTARAEAELEKVLTNLGRKIDIPKPAFGAWQQLERMVEAYQGPAQQAVAEVEKVDEKPPVPEIQKVTEALRTVVAAVAKVYAEEAREEDEEEEEHAMGR